jgi:hypothetical protein
MLRKPKTFPFQCSHLEKMETGATPVLRRCRRRPTSVANERKTALSILPMPTIPEIKSYVSHLWHVATTASRLEYASVGVGLIVAALYFKIFYKDFAGFRESISSIGDSEWWWWSWLLDWEMLKLIIWLLISVGAGFLAFHQLPGWFPHWFH